MSNKLKCPICKTENAMVEVDVCQFCGSLEGMETTWNEEGEVLSRYLFQAGKVVERFVENGVVVGK